MIDLFTELIEKIKDNFTISKCYIFLLSLLLVTSSLQSFYNLIFLFNFITIGYILITAFYENENIYTKYICRLLLCFILIFHNITYFL